MSKTRASQVTAQELIDAATGPSRGCDEGVYLLVNSRTGATRVGESSHLSSRTTRAAKQYSPCLGKPEDILTFVLPTCGKPPEYRKRVEKQVIDAVGPSCNLIRR